ncbi:MAG TPA: M48 family metalloprotease [Terriglobales bacterium]|jgi:predicted Zn-dependent protease|nr:M48 family metalloprotease [Terriglobales bacterium]
MKRWIALTGIVLLGIAAVVVSQRRKVDVPASPAAILYLVADTERELMRMPVSFVPLSDEEEIRIGDELARAYASREERETDPNTAAVEQYLARVGQPLAGRAHRRLPYKFHYIPSSYMINAFALPGGHVYVGAWLLSIMDSEDELAAVIGHEIEHIDHRHCAERAQQEQALRKLPLAALMEIPIEIFEAGYSKGQELEADREGTRLAVQAGYSANGAVRMFETFQRLYKEYQATANSPQQELSEVAMQTLEGYFRSHPLPSERIAQIQKLIASEGWTARPERDLAVAYVFLNVQAQNALTEHKYAQAEQIAKRSLKLQPNQPKALEVLAQAQFAQANFSAAAVSYRELMDVRGWTVELADTYALALAAANRTDAAAEFRRWMDSAKGNTYELRAPLAGLSLLAGNSAPEKDAIAAAHAKLGEDWSPLWLGRLAWWEYLAGNYQTAADLLSEATQQRPGDARLWVRRAWAQIEIRRFSDALQTANFGPSDESVQPERRMMEAVAFWQAKQPDAALGDFRTATLTQLEWENPAWVKALYSPLVAQSVQEMKDEAERRRQKARVAANR